MRGFSSEVNWGWVLFEEREGREWRKGRKGKGITFTDGHDGCFPVKKESRKVDKRKARKGWTDRWKKGRKEGWIITKRRIN